MASKNKSTLEPVVPVEPAEEKSEETATPIIPTEKEIAEPNEAFFGTLLIGCLALSLIAAAGYFGFSGYRYFQSLKAEKATPSIAALPVAETKEEVAPESVSPEKKEEQVSGAQSAIDKKTLEVKVLNGGAVKGVAGTYGEKLKKEGFTKTTIGNSFGNYTGATLYYAKDQEASSAILKEVVMKDYPALTVKAAEPGNKDTTAAPLVLILGR